MKSISSVQNPYIKALMQLQIKAKLRRQTGTFLVEGMREIDLALKGKYEIESLLIEPSICDNSAVQPLLQKAKQTFEITKEIYQKLAYRDSTEGILAVLKVKNTHLEDLILSKNPLILVAESLEKPGNIGAILRTADAANCDAVLLANPKCDLYNPNTIRSSVGCLFTRQVATGTTEEVIAYLKAKGIAIYSATLQDTTSYASQNYTTPTALVVGTEATGLSELWRSQSTKNISIPMQGEIDSMNVSVAAAILVFEAKRQRNFL